MTKDESGDKKGRAIVLREKNTIVIELSSVSDFMNGNLIIYNKV